MKQVKTIVAPSWLLREELVIGITEFTTKVPLPEYSMLFLMIFFTFITQYFGCTVAF